MQQVTAIIPYRNRPDHLTAFLRHMQCWPLDIIIVEQTEGKPFNRAALINVGFLDSKPQCFVAHDIDMLPKEVDYTPTYGVMQLASSDIQKVDYLGGVTMFDYQTFVSVDGYHNNYFHRAEDNEMMFNLKRHKIPIVNRHGSFEMLQHERSGVEFDPILWEKAKAPRGKEDGLRFTSYNILQKNQISGSEMFPYVHLLVEL